MRVKLIFPIIAMALVAFSAPLFAHHSFSAQYDASKPITLKGVVTRFEWTNPHARFFIDVTDDKGNVTSWNLELGSPNILARAGWTAKLWPSAIR